MSFKIKGPFSCGHATGKVLAAGRTGAPVAPFIASVLAILFFLVLGGYSQSTPATPSSRIIGTVKAINGNEITISTDSATEIHIRFQDSSRIVRTAPGQTSLKDASAITLQEMQVGDRVLIRGTASEDGKTVSAASAVVMKQSDIAARQQQEREDWQKRGIGGLVQGIDSANGTVRLSLSSLAGTKNVAVHISKSTIIRRYSPDSVKFDDAKPGTISQIKAGDQARARGTRSADGSELEADEIVSGSFRNIAGTVQSVDSDKNTVSVMDLITKRPATVKVTSDSQLRQLPAPFAQRIAMRLKGGSPDSAGASGGPGNARLVPPDGSGPRAQNGEIRGGGLGGGNRAGGPPDFQQVLSRLPAVALTDLHKGDAVMIVTTQGSETSSPTAITLLSGVEPILTASPSNTTLLSPWNLGASPGGDAAAQ